MEIRRALTGDFDQIWPLLHEVFSRGDTYTFSPDTDKKTAFSIWMETPAATYVASLENQIVGTYFIKPNQPGLGSHVCNVGYIVSSAVRGKGIGKKLCEHSFEVARNQGFTAMQYNFVVCTNTNAIQLWQKMGFEIVGRLPKAFLHQEKGMVDALVMHRFL